MWRKWKFSYQESHILDSIAMFNSNSHVNTETFHYFMCSNTHTLQMHFHARHWLQKLHIWAQLDAWRITERGIWVVLASSTRSSRLGPPSQTITKIGPFVNSFCTSSNKNQQKMYQKQMSQIIQTIQWHIVVSMKFIRLFLWHVSSEVLFSAASFRWISF